MPTIREVAEHAGVSVATVSYVVNGSRPVAPETAARVQQAIKELHYRPNSIARSLRRKATQVVGLMVSDFTNPFFSTLAQGAEDCARARGYTVLICSSCEDENLEGLYLEVLLERRIDGLALAPTSTSRDRFTALMSEGLPVVFVDRTVQGIRGDSVVSANEEGAYQATSYLIRMGHTRTGMVLGIPHISTTRERLAGYQRALSDAGLETDSTLLAYGYSTVAGAEEACRRLLSQANPPTALFAANNLMTIGVMRCIRRLGLRCPEDISVVGFDDFAWTAAFDPPLTTVAQRPYELGFKAIELLLERIEQDRPRETTSKTVCVDVELRVRGSVAPIPLTQLKGGDSWGQQGVTRVHPNV